MNHLKLLLDNYIDPLLKLLGAASTLGVAGGAFFILSYAVDIRYFPGGISLGDSLLFLLASGCFGMLYAMLTTTLIALGVLLSPIVRPLVQASFKLYQKFTGRKEPPVYELAPFDWIAIPLGLIGVLFIFILGMRDEVLWWVLPMHAVGLFFFYSIYRSSRLKLQKSMQAASALVHSKEREAAVASEDVAKYRCAQLLSLGVVMFVPLFIGGVFGPLRDGAMRLMSVRVENATVHVKAPYSALLPKEAVSTTARTMSEYNAFENVLVVFRGLGKSVVVRFNEQGTVKQVELPNESVVVQVPLRALR